MASSCAKGDPSGATSVFLTIVNGAGATVPDELLVSASGSDGVVFSDERLPRSGSLQAPGAGVLGTVTLYVGATDGDLGIDVSGFVQKVLRSGGSTSVRLVRDRQVMARVVLLPNVGDGGDGDVVGDGDVPGDGDAAGDGPAEGPGDGGSLDVVADATPDSAPADVGGDTGLADVSDGGTVDGNVDGDAPSGDAAVADAAGDAAADRAGDGASDAVGPQPLPAPFAHYAFQQTSGATAVDSSGNGHNGVLMGGATLGQVGQVGNALNLDGVAGSYVALPAGMLDAVSQVTVAAWVRVRTARDFQRVFDFGGTTTPSRSMYLVPQAGGPVRFAITTSGSTGEQRIDGPAALTVGTWQHLAVVLGPGAGGTLYLNGVPVTTNVGVTLRPVDLAPMPNLWLGRSQSAGSPHFDGQLDEVRIYDRALSAAEIAALHSLR